jgi:hypothetical protein
MTTQQIIWAQINPSPGGGGGTFTPGGRLTLTSGVPVTSSDVALATSVYYTPFVHNQVMLWDGASWTAYAFSESSISLAGTSAGAMYDIFMYQSSGTPTLELGTVWTDANTRAVALAINDGRYTKSGDKTRLYLGTTYIDTGGGGGTTSDSLVRRGLFNMYNRDLRGVFNYDNGSHTYNMLTFREWAGGTATRSNFVNGLAEGQIVATSVANINNSSTYSVTVPWINGSAASVGFRVGATAIDIGNSNTASASLILGLNYITVAEYAGGPGNTTFEEGGCMGVWMC